MVLISLVFSVKSTDPVLSIYLSEDLLIIGSRGIDKNLILQQHLIFPASVNISEAFFPFLVLYKIL